MREHRLSESKNKSIIQTTLEKGFKDTEFIRLIREIITENIEDYEFCSDIAEEAGFNVDDLNSIKFSYDVAFIELVKKLISFKVRK